MGALPVQAAALNRPYVSVNELTVHAARTGDPVAIRQAVLMDPNASSTLTPEQIWELCNDLVVAHGDLLPEPLRATIRLAGSELAGRRTTDDEGVRSDTHQDQLRPPPHRTTSHRTHGTRRRDRGRRVGPHGRAPQGATVLDTTAPVHLTMWSGQSDEAAKLLQGLVDEYEDAHPNVTIDMSSGASSTDELLQKLAASFAGNDSPDISYTFGSWASQLERSGRTLDLRAEAEDPDTHWTSSPRRPAGPRSRPGGR